MTSFIDYMEDYQRQLSRGRVRTFYVGIIQYMLSLKNNFADKYRKELIIGSFYQGYMDITYFSVTTKNLREKNLKVIVAFEHDKMRFIAYFVGQNKQVQKTYWDLLKNSDVDKYKLSENPDIYILEESLSEKEDLKDLDALAEKIEQKVMEFVNEAVKLVV